MEHDILSVYVCEDCGDAIVEIVYENGILLTNTEIKRQRNTHAKKAHNLRIAYDRMFQWVGDFKRGTAVPIPSKM